MSLIAPQITTERICPRCGKEIPLDAHGLRIYCSFSCMKKVKDKRYREGHQEYYANYLRQYNRQNREEHNLRNERWKRTNWEKFRLMTRKQRNQYRAFIMSVLGTKCVRCGFTDIRALQIDHINGGGTKDIKNKGGSIRTYNYYSKHLDEARLKLQVLCANCNWIKRAENHEERWW